MSDAEAPRVVDPSRAAGSPAVPLRQRLLDGNPAVADRWMRSAIALLLRLQAPSESTPPQPEGTPAGIEAGPSGPAATMQSALDAFACRAAGEEGARSKAWQSARSALLQDARTQPQAIVPEGFGLDALDALADFEIEQRAAFLRVGEPATCGIATLLRDGSLTFDEEREIDWAIRWWSGARRAGLLGEHDMAGDFGLCWRAIEWSAVRLNLAALGTMGVGERERRLCAQVVRSATRYRELAPLVPLVERLAGPLTQSGYELR